MRARHTLSALLLVGLMAFAALPAGAATITIINNDGPGEGFNDPTPVAPVGGNPGTTLGQQRLIAFQAAADRWGELLVSDVEILVAAEFNDLYCELTPQGWAAVLGSTGAESIHRDFPNAPFPNTFYPQALANSIAGYDLYTPPPPLVGQDMNSQFNSSAEGTPDCGLYWWYGIDGSFPYDDALAMHFFAVVLHELAHGLGMQNFYNPANGQFIYGFPDIYSRYTYDTTVGLHWHEMTNGQRLASQINTGNVVLDGPENKIEADDFLTGNNVDLIVNSGPAAGTYAGRGALFGASYTDTDGVTLDMELVDDGVGTATDGCEPLVGFTPGRIAFVDRGTCEFGLKSLNAEQAGAGGVIIADNQVSTPFQMAPGEFGRQVTIPVNYITQAAGDVIRTTLPVSGSFDVIDVNGLHMSSGFPMVYAPNPYSSGSSIAHYDVTAGPNALMEPDFNVDLYDDPDMTMGLFRDEGWETGALIFKDGFESGDTTAWSSTVP